jgi:hypothetical protein
MSDVDDPLCLPGCAVSGDHVACLGTHRQLLIDSQPAPIPNTQTPIVDLVMEDMKARKQLGIKRYGTALQPFNGRDALVDAYEEALDLAIYLRQALEEKRQREEDWKDGYIRVT